MNSVLSLSAVLAGIAVAGIAVQRIKPEIEPPVGVAGVEAHETNGAVSLIGQFRTTVSGSLWVRSDLYLHNGVQMRPLTEQELKSNIKGVHSADGLDGEMHGGEGRMVTVVPSRDRDFRGIFGDIDRATSSYKDMSNHEHNPPKAALPLFRLMTMFDPNFIQGWTVAATLLSWEKNRQAYELAVQHLKNGISENPKSVLIRNEIAFTYARSLGDLKTAKNYFEQARALLNSGEAMNDDEREGGLLTYRWLYWINRDLGLSAEQKTLISEGLSHYKDDPVLLHAQEAMNIVPTRRG